MRQETISLIEHSISLIALLQSSADSPEDILRWPTGTACLHSQFGTIAQCKSQTPAGFFRIGHWCNLYLIDLFVILPGPLIFDNEFVLNHRKYFTSHPIMYSFRMNRDWIAADQILSYRQGVLILEGCTGAFLYLLLHGSLQLKSA